MRGLTNLTHSDRIRNWSLPRRREMKLNKKKLKRITFSKHAIERFIGRLRCPAPKHPLGLMIRFLGQASDMGKIEATGDEADGRMFEYRDWGFILNAELDTVITCIKIKGRSAILNKPRYRHQRAREEKKWKKEEKWK